MLPSYVSTCPVSARQWLAIAAGIGCGVCGYAGLYPRFDDGSLRLVIALTSIPFGAAVVATGTSARTAQRAFGFTLLLAAVLGIASVVLPAMLLVRNSRADELFAMCLFGALFGAPTGALYGLPLAILSAMGHRYVHVRTHEGTDRAALRAGIWLIAIGMIGLAGTLLLDVPKPIWVVDADVLVEPSRLPAVLAGAASVAGVLLMASALVQLGRRSAWIDRVRKGLEPAFRLRPVEMRDRVELLPRISEGTTVVEWVPERAQVHDTSSPATAYRTSASGVAVALIWDESPIRI